MKILFTLLVAFAFNSGAWAQSPQNAEGSPDEVSLSGKESKPTIKPENKKTKKPMKKKKSSRRKRRMTA